MARKHAPCIPWDREGHHCLAGLLLGVACCPTGDCAICAKDRARIRRQGYTEAEVAAKVARARAHLLARCPICGLPPPPPLTELPGLPRLDRSDKTISGAQNCRTCGRPLGKGQRIYDSQECWREYVRRTEMTGKDVSSPAPPRVRRVALGRRR